MYCTVLFILAVLPVVQSGCSDYKDCFSCASSTLFFVKCRWCEMTKTCHAPGSTHNSCTTCSDSAISKLCSVTETAKCNRTIQNQNEHRSGEFEPYDAFNAILFSAVAYTDDPVICANKLFKDEPLEIVEAIGRRCDYLFKYKECFAVTAISHKVKMITLAYRGTTSKAQLVEEFATVLGRFKVSTKVGGNVQEYFSNANDQLYPCAKASLQDLVKKYPSYRVVVTGHSLGGAVASIASAQLTVDNVIDNTKTTLYTFGMPRTGDRAYAKNHDRIVTKSWRVVHFRDIVPKLPTTTLLSGSPYHHQREIFYGKDMSVISDYIECFKYEDMECGRSVSPSTSAVNYHRTYYGINVGSHCDVMTNRRRKRSDADSDISHLFTNETCKRIRVADLPTSGALRSVQAITTSIASLLLVLLLRFGSRQIYDKY